MQTTAQAKRDAADYQLPSPGIVEAVDRLEIERDMTAKLMKEGFAEDRARALVQHLCDRVGELGEAAATNPGNRAPE